MKIKALISMAILIGMNCNAAEPRNLVDQGRFEITYRALRKYLGTNKSDEDRQNCNVLAQLHVNILEDPRWEGPDPPNMEMDLATMLISVKRIAHLHSQHNNLIIQTAIDVIHLMQNDGELSLGRYNTLIQNFLMARMGDALQTVTEPAPVRLMRRTRLTEIFRTIGKFFNYSPRNEARQNFHILAQLCMDILEDQRWEGPDPPNMEMDLATMLISVKRIAHLHSQHNNLIIQTAIDVIHLMQNDGELSLGRYNTLIQNFLMARMGDALGAA